MSKSLLKMGGAIFYHIGDDPVLGANVFEDPSGLRWGDILPGTYTWQQATNECLKLNKISEQRAEVEKALAAEQRPERGCFLPRKEDFYTLCESLGAVKGEGIYTRPKGYQNLTVDNQEVISNLEGKWLWSSSSRPPDSISTRSSNDALFFNGNGGSLIDISQNAALTTRCVCTPLFTELDSVNKEED